MQAVSQAVVVVPPPSADEQQLAERLRVHAEVLGKKIGERHAERSWELADAADYIALTWQDWGFEVERQGYERAGSVEQTLSVTIPGSDRGEQLLVVGAHYDSPRGVAGENAGATGMAAVLELSRLLQTAQLSRSVRFVAFASGEREASEEDVGSVRFVRSLQAEPRALLAFLHLDRLGHLREEERSPLVLDWFSNVESERAWEPFLGAFEQEIFVLQRKQEEAQPEKVLVSDVAPFVHAGVPVLALSGADVEKAPHFEDLARVVWRLHYGLAGVLGEKLTNDAMLTPGR